MMETPVAVKKRKIRERKSKEVSACQKHFWVCWYLASAQNACHCQNYVL